MHFQGQLVQIREINVSDIDCVQNEILTFFINKEKDHLILVEVSGVFQIYDLNTFEKLSEKKAISYFEIDVQRLYSIDQIDFKNNIFYFLFHNGFCFLKYDYINDEVFEFNDPRTIPNKDYYPLYNLKNPIRFDFFKVIDLKNTLVTGYKGGKKDKERGFLFVADNELQEVTKYISDLHLCGFRKFNESFISWKESDVYKIDYPDYNVVNLKNFPDFIINDIWVCELNRKFIIKCYSKKDLSERHLRNAKEHRTYSDQNTIIVLDIDTTEYLQEIHINFYVEGFALSECQKYFGVFVSEPGPEPFIRNKIVIYNTCNFQIVSEFFLQFECEDDDYNWYANRKGGLNFFIDYPYVILCAHPFLIKYS